MNYDPGPPPGSPTPQTIVEFMIRELRRIGQSFRDDTPSVHYETIPNTPAVTTGIAANWKLAQANIFRVSTSNTITLTGIASRDANRQITLINIGSGVLTLKNESSESSASNRIVLSSATLALSANHAATLWRDAASARWRWLGSTL